MSLRRNTIANYAGQGYLALIDVIVFPFYLQLLGAEAFGLVGFLVLLQAWLRLLDMGLSPTLARQIAYVRGMGTGFADFGKLLRSFEIIFLAVAVVVATGVFNASESIATEWLDAQAISQETVTHCIALMGMIIGLRFFASLYASGIRGMEDQVWLNVFATFISTVRVVGALLLIVLVSNDIRLFFQYHVAVAALETLVLAFRLYSNMALAPHRLPFRLDLAALRQIAPFALSIAYTAGVWVFVSQSDKLILSAILPLQEFGFFTLVSLITGGILLVSGPISQAILPRLTSLLAADKQDDMVVVYRRATQLVAVVSVSAAMFVGFYSEALVYVWTGDRTAAQWCARVLPWFAFGNGILTLAAFQYYLQSAFGNLRLHVIGSTISAIVQIPVIFYAATQYGALGAGIAWFAIRLLWFAIWTAVVHRSLIPGLHSVWITRDVLPTAVTGVLVIFIVSRVFEVNVSGPRLDTGITLFLLGLTTFSLVAISSRYVRSLLLEYARPKRYTS